MESVDCMAVSAILGSGKTRWSGTTVMGRKSESVRWSRARQCREGDRKSSHASTGALTFVTKVGGGGMMTSEAYLSSCTGLHTILLSVMLSFISNGVASSARALVGSPRSRGSSRGPASCVVSCVGRESVADSSFGSGSVSGSRVKLTRLCRGLRGTGGFVCLGGAGAGSASTEVPSSADEPGRRAALVVPADGGAGDVRDSHDYRNHQNVNPLHTSNIMYKYIVSDNFRFKLFYNSGLTLSLLLASK